MLLRLVFTKKNALIVPAIAFLLSSTVKVFAQPNPLPYVTIIDSVPVKRMLWSYLPPQNIKEVRTVPYDAVYHKSAIYITLKDHDGFFKKISGNVLSADDIARKYIPGYNKNSQVIFIWNDKLLADTAEACVPVQYFLRAEVIKTQKTAYATTLPKAIILKVYTKGP